MFLKNHLNFWGDKDHNEIRFHYASENGKDAVIEVDNFEKIWAYLTLLSHDYIDEDIELWKNKFLVSDEEFQEINSFLISQGLVYHSKHDTTNTRLANFLGNWISTDTYGEANMIFHDMSVLIMGVGTVGTALIEHLLQFGICKFILVDADVVVESNLTHQRNFTYQDIGKYKCDVVKERIESVTINSHVKVYKSFLYTIDDFLDCVIGEKIDAIFWCMDQYDGKFLRNVYDWSKEQKINIYMSGYSLGGYVKGYILTEEIVKNLQDFQDSSKYVISTNSGIGILGDISGAIMVRLWLQSINSSYDVGLDTMEFNFCTPQLESKSFKAKLDIQSLFEKYEKASEVERTYLKDYVLSPLFIKLYKNQLVDSMETMDEFMHLCKKYQLDFFVKEETEANVYAEKLKNTYIPYNGSFIPIEEFLQLHFAGSRILVKDVEIFEKVLKELSKDAIKGFKNKKQKYFSYYQKMWFNKRNVKNILIQIAKTINLVFAKGLEDVLIYQPYMLENYHKTVIEELELIKKIDEINLYLDFNNFINYIQEHNYLHIAEAGNSKVCIHDPYHGMSDIIVLQKCSWTRIFSMAHEIGHAYYNTLLPKHFTEIDELTSEVFALLTEFQLMRTLEKRELDSEYIKAIKYRLEEIFLGTFALDVYEEKALCLEEITHEKLKKIQCELNKIFGISSQKKDDVYKNSFLLNTELMFEKRNVYLYPEAMLYAIDLGLRIEENSLIQKKLIDFVESATRGNYMSIIDFYKKLEIVVDANYYEELYSKVCFWLNELEGKDYCE